MKILAFLLVMAMCASGVYSLQGYYKNNQVSNTEDYYIIGTARLQVVYDDITTINVDAIVNAANQTLMKSPGGVAGYIWKAAGADELNAYIDMHVQRPLKLGYAIETPAFKLSDHGVKYIIHTPGPNCSAGDDINKLYDSYKNSILLADSLQCKSIAFPAISIGIFCCDIKTCAQLAVQSIRDIVPQTTLTDIYLVINKNPHDVNAQIYRNELLTLLRS